MSSKLLSFAMVEILVNCSLSNSVIIMWSFAIIVFGFASGDC